MCGEYTVLWCLLVVLKEYIVEPCGDTFPYIALYLLYEFWNEVFAACIVQLLYTICKPESHVPFKFLEGTFWGAVTLYLLFPLVIECCDTLEIGC